MRFSHQDFNMFARRLDKLTSSFIRDVLAITQQPDIISFAGGLPDPTLFPIQELQRAVELASTHHGPKIYQYSETRGILPLRQAICRHLAPGGCNAEEMIITSGSQQALDLLARAFLDPGDTVLVEAPSYLGALQLFTANQANIETIASDAQGPLPDALERRLQAGGVKLFYCVPDFQNPTGMSYSESRRRELADVLSRHSCWLIEDNPYGALRYRGEPASSFHSLIPEKTLYLGSFSKVLAPALRLGWLSAPDKVITAVEKMKQVTDLHTNALAQYIALEYLELGLYPEHLELLKRSYGERMLAMEQALRDSLPAEAYFPSPDGGMFFWVTLPAGIDSMELFDAAVADKVAFVPGKAFYLENQGGESELRLNFTNTDSMNIREGIARLGGLIHRRLAA